MGLVHLKQVKAPTARASQGGSTGLVSQGGHGSDGGSSSEDQ